jgi:hypothetical protein
LFCTPQSASSASTALSRGGGGGGGGARRLRHSATHAGTGAALPRAGAPSHAAPRACQREQQQRAQTAQGSASAQRVMRMRARTRTHLGARCLAARASACAAADTRYAAAGANLGARSGGIASEPPTDSAKHRLERHGGRLRLRRRSADKVGRRYAQDRVS